LMIGASANKMVRKIVAFIAGAFFFGELLQKQREQVARYHLNGGACP